MIKLKGSKMAIPVILVLVILFTALTSLYITIPSEYAVVRQFGKIVSVIDDPGLNVKLPFVQSISRLPKCTLLYDVPPTEINTLDKKRIMVDYYAIWNITDPQRMIETLRTQLAAESRLGDIIYSNIRTELGKLNFDQIVNLENSSRDDFDVVVKNKVNDILKQNGNGINLVDIKMKRADLPSTNEQSVYTRMISERESKAQEYLSQGDAEAIKIKAETDREVGEMLARADREAKEIIAEGEKEAARIYNEAYGKDPAFFELYLTLDSYATTLNGEPVIIIPSKSPYAKYIIGY
ncbi:protease modulator HflC [Lutispora saccharofermentans]|uniref:Protein HflC n=1 Tax=Lutispora saccharofermentans TaxID=3024236 RepID=A0ABT1NKU0_9FIRM|nr:protease modulator HflC [Lutispora saccharofermentans]MCQ1531714.1 protease modulator HflC [Lutispora saccharofermentans]